MIECFTELQAKCPNERRKQKKGERERVLVDEDPDLIRFFTTDLESILAKWLLPNICTDTLSILYYSIYIYISDVPEGTYIYFISILY